MFSGLRWAIGICTILAGSALILFAVLSFVVVIGLTQVETAKQSDLIIIGFIAFCELIFGIVLIVIGRFIKGRKVNLIQHNQFYESWRDDDPTDAQLDYADNLGIDYDIMTITKGQLSDLITHAKNQQGLSGKRNKI